MKLLRGRRGGNRFALCLMFMFWTAAGRAETIRFGVILPLTGPVERIGAQQLHGIQFAVDRVNGKGGVLGNRIELVVEDNQAQADASIVVFNRMMDRQRLPVIFTGWSNPVLAMAPLATRNRVLLVNASAQADKLATASPYLINTLPAISREVSILTNYLIGAGKTKMAILFENAAAGISGRDDFLDAWPAAGGTIVALESTAFGQNDFRSSLLKLAEARPDVLLVSITAGQKFMARQYKQLGLEFTVAGTAFFQDPELINEPSAKGFVHTQLQIEAPAALSIEFKGSFGTEMEFTTRQFYNATLIVLTALEKVLADGQPVTGEAMRPAIFKIRHFQGLVPLEFTGNTANLPIGINIIGHPRPDSPEPMGAH